MMFEVGRRLPQSLWSMFTAAVVCTVTVSRHFQSRDRLPIVPVSTARVQGLVLEAVYR